MAEISPEMRQQMRDRVCNREYGYEQGRNDAREGKEMDSGFSADCDASGRKLAMTGYREGYEAARKELTEGDDKILVKGPGGIDIRVGGPRHQVGWVCEMDMFGKHYTGLGETRGKAKRDVQQQCERDNNSIHCQNMHCREDL